MRVTTVCHPLRRTKPLCGFIVAALLAANLCGQQGPSGDLSFSPPPRGGAVIHGRVIGADGNPVFGVVVLTGRIDAPPNERALTMARATTRIDGYFSITGLAPATYRLCVDAQGKEFLDPCEWSEAPVTVQLEENGIIQDIDIPVEAAEMVTIEVDDQTDALGKLADPGVETKTKPAGNLILGLKTRTGNLSRARLAAADKQTKKLRYTVPAPKDEDLEFLMMPVRVDLKDTENTLLNERGSALRISKEEKAQKSNDEPVIAITLAKKGQ